MANEILLETIEMARNLINQVPCFLFTLKSLELRQDLIYSKLFRETRTLSTVGVFEEDASDTRNHSNKILEQKANK